MKRQWQAEIQGEEKPWLIGRHEEGLFADLVRTPGVRLRMVGCPEILEVENDR